MSTSGTIEWPMTAGEMVRQAMIELGALSAGEAPDIEDTNDAIVRLNAMLKDWSLDLNEFREESGTVTVTGGSGAVSLDADVLNVSSARLVVSSTQQRPLVRWNRDQYFNIPNRSQAGNPIAFYVQRAVTGTAIYLWPVPAADVTLHLDYGRAAETVTAATETVDIPQEWQSAAILGLAERCINLFGAGSVAPEAAARAERDADVAYQRLLDRERPDSIYFEPWDGLYA